MRVKVLLKKTSFDRFELRFCYRFDLYNPLNLDLDFVGMFKLTDLFC